MGYSHASRDLRNRNDIYCFIPSHQGYSIPGREYGAGPDLSGYLRAAGWNASYFRPNVYIVTADSYRGGNVSFNKGSSKLYDQNYPNHARGYSGKQLYNSFSSGSSVYNLEKRLFLN